MTDEVEIVIAEAKLGLDVENFINSDVGRFLLGCADQDEKDAVGS